MEKLELIYDYKDIEELRLSFNQLAKSVFDIDFEKYYKSGFWGDQYICYSYTDNGRVVANVSANLIDIVINGENIPSIQIGTVMTHPEYRGKGLAKKLMNLVIEKYEAERDVIYLFANKTVLDFYPKFGFKPVRQSLFSYKVKDKSSKLNHVRKLDITNKEDIRLILNLSSDRKPISKIFGVDHAQSLLFFYCHYFFSDFLYYLDDIHAVVIYSIEEECVHIYDIISTEQINFDSISDRIIPDNINKAVFHFTPDFRNVEIISEPYDDHNDTFFVRSKTVIVPEHLMYPEIAHA